MFDAFPLEPGKAVVGWKGMAHLAEQANFMSVTRLGMRSTGKAISSPDGRGQRVGHSGDLADSRCKAGRHSFP